MIYPFIDSKVELHLQTYKDYRSQTIGIPLTKIRERLLGRREHRYQLQESIPTSCVVFCCCQNAFLIICVWA